MQTIEETKIYIYKKKLNNTKVYNFFPDFWQYNE